MTNTVKLSPRRQLEVLFGIVASRPTRPTAGSWMKFGCGDLVRERHGRHVGRVEAVKWSHIVVVRWTETGWLSEFSLHDGALELVARADR